MSRRRALVVGVGYYETWGELPGCLNDADEMEWALEQNADGSENFAVVNVKGTADDPLTRRNLMDEFDLLMTGVDGCDLLFYFSGHGSITKFGLELAMSDAESAYAAGVPFDVLMHRAQQENFASLTCILDCCFAGSATELGIDDQLGISLMRPNQTILAAAQRGESALATSEISDYTAAIIAGLAGAAVDHDQRVTPLELHRHASGEMVKLSNSHPVWKSNLAGPVILRQC